MDDSDIEALSSVNMLTFSIQYAQLSSVKAKKVEFLLRCLKWFMMDHRSPEDWIETNPFSSSAQLGLAHISSAIFQCLLKLSTVWLLITSTVCVLWPAAELYISLCHLLSESQS